MRNLIAIITCLILCFVAPHSKADTNEFPITASDKAFFEKIQKAILVDNVELFSETVRYPIVLKSSKGPIELKSEKDLKENAALIFTPQIKSVIRSQTPDSLFKNWQGVMVGNGEIWFSETGKKTEKGIVWTYRIIGINLPEARSPKAEKGERTKNPPAKKAQ